MNDEMLDEASEDSFPASDPPAVTIPNPTGEEDSTGAEPAKDAEETTGDEAG